VKSRFITFFPYLPLSSEATIGDDWRLVSRIESITNWPSPGLRDAAIAIIQGHRDYAGEELDRPTIAIYRGEVMPAERPPTHGALQQAVTLAALMTNPAWHPDADASRAVTTDNCAIQQWSCSENQFGFVEHRGAVVRVMNGGVSFGRGDYIRAPLELFMPFAMSRFDDELATVTYGVLTDDTSVLRPRLDLAIEWLSQAWLNTPGIGWGVRCAFLVFGFEALLKGDGWTQAKRLRTRFEAIDPELGSEGLLWSLNETESMILKVNGVDHPATPLQHWYLTLSRHRNSIVHADANPVGPIYAEGTAYDGPLFQVAERVLRDLLKVELILVSGVALTKDKTQRAIIAYLQEAFAASDDQPDGPADTNS